jgi:hypothetical protein
MGRPATIDDLDPIKRQIETLQRNIDKVAADLAARVRSEHDVEQRMRRTERLDVDRLLRLQDLDYARILHYFSQQDAAIIQQAKAMAQIAKLTQLVTRLAHQVGL